MCYLSTFCNHALIFLGVDVTWTTNRVNVYMGRANEYLIRGDSPYGKWIGYQWDGGYQISGIPQPDGNTPIVNPVPNREWLQRPTTTGLSLISKLHNGTI